jgi:glycosyltransferase involved in cell wall biosynthesis
VGFLGRIVEEKGLALLIDAFLKLDLGPDARLLIGGDFEGVAGGSVIAQLRAHAPDDDRVRFLGFIPEERLADFYASLDCFAFPSVNSFEAFGIVQVEAMSAGVPVVASNRPGVRVPVTRTGFGQVVAENDVGALAEGIAIELQHPRDRRAGRAAIEQFGVHSIVSAYDDLLSRLGRPK